MPKVSILICSYNAGEYIKNTLRSCLDQTFGDFEILILDNASTDETVAHIRSFDSQKITLIEGRTNLGPYAGLNVLLERARWTYIAIQDHDDIWHPDKLRQQVDFLDGHPEYVGCGCTMVMYYEADRNYFEYSLGETADYALHPGIVYRNRPNLRYDASTSYMADAHFLKNILCGWKKLIHNIATPLALHVVKGAQGNYSYRWFKLNMANIRRIAEVHGHGFYSLFVLGFEIKRKIAYPLLNRMGAFKLIAKIERLPFVLMGNRVRPRDGKIGNGEVWEMFGYLP